MFYCYRRASALVIYASLLVLALWIGQLNAQSSSEEKPPNENSLTAGSKSLQFKMAGDFLLTSFKGAMLSAKKHFTDRSALRFGIGLEGEIGNSDDGSRESDFTAFKIDIIFQCLYYFAPDSPVNFYFGAGPKIGFQRNKIDSDVDYDYMRSWTIGALGTWGVEWFAIESVSLFCEYGAGIQYAAELTDRSSSSSYNNAYYNKSNSFSLYSKSVEFGLSVYF